MSQPESAKKVASTTGVKPAVKKPYQKPQVRHERVFETMALACGKTSPSQGQCRANRRVS
jgi:hypothetical protein